MRCASAIRPQSHNVTNGSHSALKAHADPDESALLCATPDRGPARVQDESQTKGGSAVIGWERHYTVEVVAGAVDADAGGVIGWLHACVGAVTRPMRVGRGV